MALATGQGPDRPDPRAVRRALGGVRGNDDDRRQPGLRSFPSSPASARPFRCSACRSPVSALVAAVAVIALISLGSFSRVQYLFVGIGVIVSAAYMISAILAKPDWGAGAPAPRASAGPVHRRLLAGRRRHGRHDDHAVGPGLHPGLRRGQAPAPRRTAGRAHRRAHRRAHHEHRRRVHRHRLRRDAVGERHHDIKDAADAAKALGPVAGNVAAVIFAIGLLAASLLGLGVVPLATRLHHVRGVRLGAGRRLALARGARSSTACWRSSSASPRCSCSSRACR